jgi:hypothetical protein
MSLIFGLTTKRSPREMSTSCTAKFASEPTSLVDLQQLIEDLRGVSSYEGRGFQVCAAVFKHAGNQLDFFISP